MYLLAGPDAGPFTLLHLPTGEIRLYVTARVAAAFLRARGIARLIGDPAFAELVRPTVNRSLDIAQWRLTNVYGERLSSADLPAAPLPSRRRDGGFGARWRLPWRQRWRTARLFRVVREAASRDDLEAPPRASRRAHLLPTAWDDLTRHTERCWKRQRRTQWKPRRAD